MRRELLERLPQPPARPEQPGLCDAPGDSPRVPPAVVAPQVLWLPGAGARSSPARWGAAARPTLAALPVPAALSGDPDRRHCAGDLVCRAPVLLFASLSFILALSLIFVLSLIPPSTPGANQPAGCFLLLIAPSRAMSWHALRKRVGWLFGSGRRQRPSSSPSGQPCAAAAAAGASELRDEVQGRLHRAAARRDRAWLRPWRWWFKRVDMEPRDQLRRSVLWATDGTPWLLLAGGAATFSEPSSTSHQQASPQKKAKREYQHGVTSTPQQLSMPCGSPRP